MSGKKILLVDDEENILDAYSSLLRGKGFSVVTFDNARTAIKEFFKSPFDLIITDLGMTEENGFTLLEEIKEKSPDTPVIVLTGSMRSEIISKYLSILGAYALIEKTCSDEIFISYVMNALGIIHD